MSLWYFYSGDADLYATVELA